MRHLNAVISHENVYRLLNQIGSCTQWLKHKILWNVHVCKVTFSRLLARIIQLYVGLQIVTNQSCRPHAAHEVALQYPVNILSFKYSIVFTSEVHIQGTTLLHSLKVLVCPYTESIHVIYNVTNERARFQL